MRAGPDAAFGAFVECEHETLLRLARLLEEDPRDADALVRTSLARVRRRWRRHARRGDPAVAARAAIVRQVLARRPSDGPRTSGWVDEFDAAWDADGSGELRRALAGLPVRTRTATVLALWAGLPDEEVARLLRDDADAVRAEVAAGRARLGSVLAPVRLSWQPVPGSGPPPDDDLRHRLAALPEVPVPARAAGLADTARRDARAVRRRRLAGTVAACAAVAVAVPLSTGPAPAPEPSAGTAQPSRGPSPLSVDVTRLPARGSLAADAAFLAAVRALPWTSNVEWGIPEELFPSVEDRRVLFAGDVPGGRWALVAGPPAPVEPGSREGPFLGDELMTAWFTGPPGARAEDLRMSSYPYGVPPGALPSLVDPRSGTLVLLAPPGAVVEVSRRPEVHADGSRSRVWERIDGQDGIAVTRLPTTGLPWTWSTSYRVLRGDGSSTTTTTGVPDVLMTGGSPPALPPLDVRYPRGRPPAGQPQVAEEAAGMVLTALGLSPDEVEITALVTGPMPAPATGQLAMIGVRVPSGAVVLTGSWNQTLPDGTTATMGECGTDVRPAADPVTERVVAMGCEVWDAATGIPKGSVLVVSAPPSVAAVRTYDGDGDYLGEHSLTDGSLVVPMATGTTAVEAVTADGVLLGRSGLLPTGVWLGE